MRLVALINGFHLVSPGSSFISSISATSISGLRGGEEVTEMTLGGEDSNLLEGSLELNGTSPPPPPPRNEAVLPVECVGGVMVLGPRTLMVTSLLGVRLIDGSPPASSEDWDELWEYGGVFGAWASSESVGVAPDLSADMLR